MNLGYYNKPLKIREKVLPVVLLAIVIVTVLWVNMTEYPSVPIFFLVLPVLSILIISFLIPPLLFKIDMGKFYNLIIWLVPLTILAFGIRNELVDSNFLSVLKVPLVLFLYMHLMRTLHFSQTKSQPAIGATWFRKGDNDRIANRKISGNDIYFNMLYTAIPLVSFVVFIWFRELYR